VSSLYLHIPFCSRKCPYCDFFSQVGSQQQINEYVELLIINLQILKRDNSHDTPFNTIFFGGGTPSLLSVGQVEAILNKVEQLYGIASHAEITLEANPGTLDFERLQGYYRAGVNRLSLGVQSLNDQKLQLLGRIHNASQARESILAARAAGFENLSLDLMFALPDQDLSSLEQEISALLSFEPEHISLYGLSFEKGTEFYLQLQSGQLTACEEDLYAEQYRLLHGQLAVAGFEHYEISNFARPNRRCHHNQVYWKREDCLAIGAGAHSFSSQKWGTRWYIPENLQSYQESLWRGEDPAEILETYDRQGAMREFAYLALRTRDGIDLQEFEERFNLSLQQVFPEALDKIQNYLDSPLTSGRCRFNLNGWLIYDHLISHFL